LGSCSEIGCHFNGWKSSCSGLQRYVKKTEAGEGGHVGNHVIFHAKLSQNWAAQQKWHIGVEFGHLQHKPLAMYTHPKAPCLCRKKQLVTSKLEIFMLLDKFEAMAFGRSFFTQAFDPCTTSYRSTAGTVSDGHQVIRSVTSSMEDLAHVGDLCRCWHSLAILVEGALWVPMPMSTFLASRTV
jgi:hypothetical protein